MNDNTTRLFADGDRVIWGNKVVDIMGARFDYPLSSVKWDGTLKAGAFKEWHYRVLGSSRDIRQKNLRRAPNQNSRRIEDQGCSPVVSSDNSPSKEISMTATKTPAKKTTKTENKSGLRKPQLRILKALSKKSPMTRGDIAKKAPVDVAACVEYIGSSDDSVRKANDKKHFPSLITLGMVRFANDEDTQGASYEITAKGREAAKKG